MRLRFREVNFLIISASRRTDIPAYYSDWFCNRIREGYVDVRNPMNFHQVSRIVLSPEVVDGIVFWTKNPLPLMPRLDELRNYPFYFQFTLTPYGKDIEPGVPSKNDVILPAFRELSQRIGPERVIWRYDPILLTTRYTTDYHIAFFSRLAQRLEGYTHKCVISFVDLYRNTKNNMKGLGFSPLTEQQIFMLAQQLVLIADRHHLVLETCAEQTDLTAFGISHGHCIDRSLLERLAGCGLLLGKDKNQRPECGCMASIDIGMYDTCRHGCKYCYATHSSKALVHNTESFDPQSPLLCGRLLPEDVVKDRTVKSCKERQMRFC